MLEPKYTIPSGGLTLQKEIQAKIDKVFYEGRVIPCHTDYEHFYKDKEDGEIYPSVTTVLSVIAKPYLKQWAVNRGIEYVRDWAINMPVINRIDLYDVLERSKTAHKNVLETAALWGIDGHNVIDRYVELWIDRGKQPAESILDMASDDISNEGKAAALGAERFFNKHTLFPIVSEKKILSKKHKIGGTLDSLWLIGETYKRREGDKHCVHKWLEKPNKDIVCSECGREEKLSLILIDLKTSNQTTSPEYALQVASYSAILSEMCKVKPKIHWILQLNKKKPDYTIGVVEDVGKHAKAFLHAFALFQHIRAEREPVKMLKVKTVIKL